MIDVATALRLLLCEALPLDTVEIPVDQALGRVLGEYVQADRDFPPAHRSAMDGYAVRAADLPVPGTTLRITGEVRAGQATAGLRVDPGCAVRIFTGALIPEGADAVVMVELTREAEEPATVFVRERPELGQHIRPRGEDVREADRILEPGALVGPAEIAALVTVGRMRVRIVRPPVVKVLSTGDEVVPLATPPQPHQVRNSNAWALLAQLAELGLAGEDLGIAEDAPDELSRSIGAGLESDVLLVTGGVSRGAYDLVGTTLEQAGMTTIFHGVAIRPGKPMLAGRKGRCLVVGLPGNPVSAFTDFAVFVAPALRRMMGCRKWDNLELEAVLTGHLRRAPERATYHLVHVEIEDGILRALPVRSMGSGDVVSMCRANAFAVTAAGAGGVEDGARVPVLLWRDFQIR